MGSDSELVYPQDGEGPVREVRAFGAALYVVKGVSVIILEVSRSTVRMGTVIDPSRIQPSMLQSEQSIYVIATELLLRPNRRKVRQMRLPMLLMDVALEHSSFRGALTFRG